MNFPRIVQYGNFSCAACIENAQVWDGILLEKYGVAQFEYQYLPSRERGWGEAEQAVMKVAGQGFFWKLSSAAAAMGEGVTPARVVEAAGRLLLAEGKAGPTEVGDLGLNVLAAQRLKIQKLPTVFVNGLRVEGLRPRSELSRLLDEELAHARELIQRGAATVALKDLLSSESGTTRDRIQFIEPGGATARCQDHEGRGAK